MEVAGPLASSPEIPFPRDITYRNALEYIDWRTAYKKKSGKTVGRNTAIFELKTLAMIIGEAVRLGHAAPTRSSVSSSRRTMPLKNRNCPTRKLSAFGRHSPRNPSG